MDSSLARPALSSAEKRRRKNIEARIKKGLYDAWIGLRDIRDEKLWRSTHDNFDLYCQEVWGYGSKRGYQVAKAGDVVAGLLAAGAEVLPTNEKQARELIGLTPEEARMVLTVVRQSSPTGRVTAAHLKQVGETLKEIVTTGAVSDGDGEQYRLNDVVKSGLVAETHERMLRQWDHIHQNSKFRDQFVGEVIYSKGTYGIWAVWKLLATLDPDSNYLVRVYRK